MAFCHRREVQKKWRSKFVLFRAAVCPLPGMSQPGTGVGHLQTDPIFRHRFFDVKVLSFFISNNNKIFSLSSSSSSPKLSQSMLLQQPHCLPNAPQSKQLPFFVCSVCLFHSMVTLVSMSWGKERMRTCRLRGGFVVVAID